MSLDITKFPRAIFEGYAITSPETDKYNCIAYAAGDTQKNWWPNSAPLGYWPKNIPERETIYAFIRLYKSLGYDKCDNSDLEDGFEKVAIYALDKVVTHAAKQLPNGHWTSKIGWNVDIEHHTLDALCGPCYGEVVQFLKRPITSKS